ncbi:hypothetical protein H5410_034815 [Solanum commersonii]|uniref:Uncharacterized protein n=1 Tax=Solanum commersonii TaxID=4109 RepID=A0A9J5YUD4_SOLCO|nr:hypothetical protein H5410_034815 [Solanum commersonii]
MSLSYITPAMKNGEKVIELKKDEIDKATEEWKQALILYVVGELPTIAAMERYIALQVNTVSKPKVPEVKEQVVAPREEIWKQTPVKAVGRSPNKSPNV